MLDAHKLAWNEEIQTCRAPDGTPYVFASRLMLEHCIKTRQPIQMVAMDDAGYEAVSNSGLVRRKMRNLKREWGDKIHENNYARPILFARLTPTFSFVADGNHRYAYMWENGVTLCFSYLCDRNIWEQFLVTNFGEVQASRNSDIC